VKTTFIQINFKNLKKLIVGANNDKYIPASAFNDSPDQLAEKWISEWGNGIETTGKGI
jgi:hypothetical protein